ncbi:MAG: hypothetical protein ACD_13C00246G0003 [uncultured bacterium]|nr:MAG: hypothetical protein ACD_13C00246G0003 [uncultured bacterium]
MPAAGDVLHYENFTFDNGHVQNKFFIVLHGNPCLMIITTSQSLRYPMVDTLGCNPDKFTFYFPARYHTVFTKPTYLAMQKIYELSRSKAHELMAQKVITKKTPLTPKILLAVKECLKHFRDDIADEHWNVIFTPNAASASALESLASKFNRRR